MKVRTPVSRMLGAIAVLGVALVGSMRAWSQESSGAVQAESSGAPTNENSPNGTLIVLNKAEASASLIDLATGREILKLETGVGPHEVAVSPDGKTAVVANYGAGSAGNTLTVIDLQAKEIASTIELAPHGRPHGIEYLADGRHVAVTTEQSQNLLVVDVVEGKVKNAIGTAARVSHMVAVTPDGTRAFVANIGSGSITAVDLTNNEKLKEISTGGGAEGVAITPNGAEVWVTNRAADTVSVVDVHSLEVVAELPCGVFPIRIKITPDGKRALVSNARTGDVAVFDVKKRELLKRISMNESATEDTENRLFSDQFGTSPVPVGILIDPAGNFAFINTNADIITVIDLKSLEIVNRLRAGQEPDGLGWSPLVLKK